MDSIEAGNTAVLLMYKNSGKVCVIIVLSTFYFNPPTPADIFFLQILWNFGMLFKNGIKKVCILPKNFKLLFSTYKWLFVKKIFILLWFSFTYFLSYAIDIYTILMLFLQQTRHFWNFWNISSGSGDIQKRIFLKIIKKSFFQKKLPFLKSTKSKVTQQIQFFR